MKLSVLLFLGLAFSGLAQADIYPRGALSCKPTDKNPLKCLVCSIYFEARGESQQEQVDVAQTMITRVLDRRYPDTMCGVVWEKSQFSWTHDGKPDNIPNGSVLRQVVKSARIAVNSGPNGYTNYHATYVNPGWRCKSKERRGAHIFCNKGFQRQASDLLVRDILANLEMKDVPIPTPAPREVSVEEIIESVNSGDIPVALLEEEERDEQDE